MEYLITLGINLLVSFIVAFGTAFFTIGKYKEKVDNLEREKQRISEKMDGMKSDLDRLLEFKVNAQKFIDSKIYEAKSPVKLTDYGQSLIQDSGFLEIFEKEKDNLLKMLEEKNPKTQYDVQEIARSLMDSLGDYAPFEPLKTYAFQNGKDLGQILRAGAIPLRDYYLLKHAEIKD